MQAPFPNHRVTQILKYIPGSIVGTSAAFIDAALTFNNIHNLMINFLSSSNMGEAEKQRLASAVAAFCFTSVMLEGILTEGVAAAHEGKELIEKGSFQFKGNAQISQLSKLKKGLIYSAGGTVCLFFLAGIASLSYEEVVELLGFANISDVVMKVVASLGTVFDVGGHAAFELPEFLKFSTSIIFAASLTPLSIYRNLTKRRASAESQPLIDAGTENEFEIKKLFTEITYGHGEDVQDLTISGNKALFSHIGVTVGILGLTMAIVTDLNHFLHGTVGLAENIITPLLWMSAVAAVFNGNGRYAVECKESIINFRSFLSELKGSSKIILPTLLAFIGMCCFGLVSFEASREFLHTNFDQGENTSNPVLFVSAIIGIFAAGLRAAAQDKYIVRQGNNLQKKILPTCSSWLSSNRGIQPKDSIEDPQGDKAGPSSINKGDDTEMITKESDQLVPSRRGCCIIL